MGSMHQAVRKECSHSCGQRKEELGLTGNLVSSSLHLIPPPPHFSPWAPRLCLCFKWQDTNQKWEWEWARLSLQGCAGSSGLWFQHMHLAFCNIPPLHPMLCVDSKGMIHPDKGAHGFFNAKHLLCKTWETRGEVYFFLCFLENSLLLPTPCPVLHSWDRLSYEKLCVYDIIPWFSTQLLQFSPLPLFSQFTSCMRLPVQLKPREEEKTGYKALITLSGSFANREWESATNSNFSVSDKQ